MPAKKETSKTRRPKETLTREPARVWDRISSKERKEAFDYAQSYIDFLNRARTERRAVRFLVESAAKRGFRDINSRGRRKERVFFVSRGKLLFMAITGKRPMIEGIRVICSHIDSPRLDLKPNPLYEDTGLALLKTHYYGGIKKFHWVSRSLALCGTVVRGDGSSIEVDVGFDANDPMLTITDLLPHLSRQQMEKKASEFIPAESLNVVAASLPCEDLEAENRVKLAVLELLHRKYGITEEDLITSELQLVPAEPARSAGLDGSFVAGYGQDDRACAFTSFTALLETAKPEHTAIALFYDKEEIGSEGNTGAKSRLLDLFLMELMEATGLTPSAINLHRVYLAGKALSADVASGYDPTYADVYEKRNSPKVGCGINLKKYTGHGGKFMASEANAEYAGWVRKLYNEAGVMWQAGEMGKVDEGGGGTVSKFLASTGMEVLDCGPPLLGMHSPLELVAKDDVWTCRKAFKSFFGS